MNPIEEYIATFPAEVQDKLKTFHIMLREEVPGATEKISYGLATFVLHGTNLVHFGARKQHIGFYPAPSGVAAFAARLTGYKTSKGAIQFPLNQELPAMLIRDITRFRIEEVTKAIEEKKKK